MIAELKSSVITIFENESILIYSFMNDVYSFNKKTFELVNLTKK